jgi:hypothetical protein
MKVLSSLPMRIFLSAAFFSSLLIVQLSAQVNLELNADIQRTHEQVQKKLDRFKAFTLVSVHESAWQG